MLSNDFHTLPKIKVIGIGGGGCNAINRMQNFINSNVDNNIEYIAVNSDIQALKLSKAQTKLQIGAKLTKGLGCADPEIGERAAQENQTEIKHILSDADMVFLVAGLGGGMGSGALPEISFLAKEMGKLTVAIVTTPFTFEGKTREQRALNAIQKISKSSDSYIVVQNDSLINEVNKNKPVLEVFKQADDIIVNCIKCITNIIAKPTLINLDFADVSNTLKNKGLAFFGFGFSNSGTLEALKEAVTSNLAPLSIENASSLIIAFKGNKDLNIASVNEAINLIKDVVSSKANILFGVDIDSEMEGVSVSIIASGFLENQKHLNFQKDLKIINEFREPSSIDPTNSYIKFNDTKLYNYIIDHKSQKIDHKAQKAYEAFQEYKEEQLQKIIFLSYSHNDKDIVDQIDNTLSGLLKNSFQVTRDERGTQYKDNFKTFMKLIPAHNYVLMIVSESYLKSDNCMFEVLECMKNNDYEERILFIILEDANIYASDSLLKYKNYWDERQKNREEIIIKEANAKNFPPLISIIEDWKRDEKIKLDICDLIKMLKDQKGIKLLDLQKSNFKQIIDYINSREEKKKKSS